MFGCIVAGRLVQTNLQQIDATKYVFELSDASSINHLVVFLTGAAPFPPGYAATVHFLWPAQTNPTWTLLGHISNEKPSAIFRLGGKKALSVNRSMDTLMEDSSAPQPQPAFATAPSISAQLGISIEPIQQVMAQVATLPQVAHTLGSSMSDVSSNALAVVKPAAQTDPSNIANKLLENLYNHCTSFAGSLPMGAATLFNMNWETTYIPLKALQDWYNNVQRKIKSDPTFLAK